MASKEMSKNIANGENETLKRNMIETSFLFATTEARLGLALRSGGRLVRGKNWNTTRWLNNMAVFHPKG